MSEPRHSVQLTPEALTARRRRNVWIALGLVAFIVLLFTTTFLRMMHNQEQAAMARAAQPTAGVMTAPTTAANP